MTQKEAYEARIDADAAKEISYDNLMRVITDIRMKTGVGAGDHA